MCLLVEPKCSTEETIFKKNYSVIVGKPTESGVFSQNFADKRSVICQEYGADVKT